MRHCVAIVVAAIGAVAAGPAAMSAGAEDIPLEILQRWNIYNTSGWNFVNSGRYDQAEDRFRRAIEEIRPYVKSDYRLMARSYADLAQVFYYQGRYADAEPLAAWALSVRESTPGVNPDAVFKSLYTLAAIQIAQEHFNQAEPLLRRALAIQEENVGPNHKNTADTLDELAGVLAEQRKFAEAERLYKRAISIYKRISAETNADLAACNERFAAMLDKLDRKAEADELREQAKKIREAIEATTARGRDSRARPDFKPIKKK
jgi:tetratricopeptide (TPR) repeat protein